MKFKLDSSAHWRPRHWNTEKFNLNVKEILLPVISFLGVVTLCPWGKEGQVPQPEPCEYQFGEHLAFDIY